MKFVTRGSLGSLITNPSSVFRNTKFQIQYGEPKCKQQKVLMQTFHLRYFWKKKIDSFNIDRLDYSDSILNVKYY